MLEEHRDRALRRAKLLDVASIDEWYLFSSDPAHGRPLNPDWVTHRYTDMATNQGISTHVDELRYYSATELLSAGIDLATVSGRLGHGGGGATTLRVYAAWVAASDQRTAEVLGATNANTADTTGRVSVSGGARHSTRSSSSREVVLEAVRTSVPSRQST